MPFDVHVEAILPQLDIFRPVITSAAREIRDAIAAATVSRAVRIALRIAVLFSLSVAFSVAVQVLDASDSLHSSISVAFKALTWTWIILMLCLALFITLELIREYACSSPELLRFLRTLKRFLASPSSSRDIPRAQRIAVNPVDFTHLSDLEGPLQLEQYINTVTARRNTGA